jgi:hypothetical protein
MSLQTSNEPMSTMQATNKQDFTFPQSVAGTMSQIPVSRSSSSTKSLLQGPSDPPLSSGLDFLMQMHIRRENTDAKAQRMTRKERTMIKEGTRKERTTMLAEALMIVDAE